MLRLSEEGFKLLKDSEEFRSKMYPCPAGHCTIAYGHLIHKGPICTGHPEVTDAVLKKFGLTREICLALEKPYVNGVFLEQAERMLRTEVAEYEEAVRSLVKVPIDQSEFDCLVDFSYNLGKGALKQSTLLKKLNAQDYDGAANEFQKWVFADGHKLSGLATRRAAEKALFVRDLPRVPANA